MSAIYLFRSLCRFDCGNETECEKEMPVKTLKCSLQNKHQRQTQLVDGLFLPLNKKKREYFHSYHASKMASTKIHRENKNTDIKGAYREQSEERENQNMSA